MDGGAWWAAVHGVAKSRTRLSNFTFTHWRRKWQRTPVFLPGESQGWGAWWAAVSRVAHVSGVGHDWSNLAAAAVGIFHHCYCQNLQDLPQQFFWHTNLCQLREAALHWGLQLNVDWAESLFSQSSSFDGGTGQWGSAPAVQWNHREPLQKARRPSQGDSASVCLVWTVRCLFSSGYCFNILLFNKGIFQTYRGTEWIHSTYHWTHHLDFATYSLALGRGEEGGKKERREGRRGRWKM